MTSAKGTKFFFFICIQFPYVNLLCNILFSEFAILHICFWSLIELFLKAVPDSCCLKPTKGCGKDLFNKHSLKKMAEYVKKIHVHGCLHAMDKVLKVHTLIYLITDFFILAKLSMTSYMSCHLVFFLITMKIEF